MVPLVLGLDALGDEANVKLARQADDGVQYRTAGAAATDAGNERAVDLKALDR